MKDRYLRKDSKWAKVSGPVANRYAVALGWKGDTKAANIQHTLKMGHAIIVAENWINDHQ